MNFALLFDYCFYDLFIYLLSDLNLSTLDYIIELNIFWYKLLYYKYYKIIILINKILIEERTLIFILLLVFKKLFESFLDILFEIL